MKQDKEVLAIQRIVRLFVRLDLGPEAQARVLEYVAGRSKPNGVWPVNIPSVFHPPLNT